MDNHTKLLHDAMGFTIQDPTIVQPYKHNWDNDPIEAIDSDLEELGMKADLPVDEITEQTYFYQWQYKEALETGTVLLIIMILKEVIEWLM